MAFADGICRRKLELLFEDYFSSAAATKTNK
jgi:hypothetical protein